MEDHNPNHNPNPNPNPNPNTNPNTNPNRRTLILRVNALTGNKRSSWTTVETSGVRFFGLQDPSVASNPNANPNPNLGPNPDLDRFFCLQDPSVAPLLERLPLSFLCSNYVFRWRSQKAS